jgi:hypothetical protein
MSEPELGVADPDKVDECVADPDTVDECPEEDLEPADCMAPPGPTSPDGVDPTVSEAEPDVEDRMSTAQASESEVDCASEPEPDVEGKTDVVP